MASGPITSCQMDGETVETVTDFIFLGSKITADGDCSHEIKRIGRKAMTKPESILKSGDITLSTKVCLVKAMVFPVVMYGCESWTIKKAERQRIDALEGPLECKEIKPVNPKGNHSWISIGRTDAEAKTPLLWSLDVKNWLTGKDSDAGQDWRQEEKGMTEDKMVGWHHRLDGHEFEYILGVGDGQGGLVCCSPWGLKELDTTEWLNWTAETGFVILFSDPDAPWVEKAGEEEVCRIRAVHGACVHVFKWQQGPTLPSGPSLPSQLLRSPLPSAGGSSPIRLVCWGHLGLLGAAGLSLHLRGWRHMDGGVTSKFST